MWRTSSEARVRLRDRDRRIKSSSRAAQGELIARCVLVCLEDHVDCWAAGSRRFPNVSDRVLGERDYF